MIDDGRTIARIKNIIRSDMKTIILRRTECIKPRCEFVALINLGNGTIFSYPGVPTGITARITKRLVCGRRRGTKNKPVPKRDTAIEIVANSIAIIFTCIYIDLRVSKIL